MVRIGLYDRSFRRSTWARVEYGEPETDVDHILGHGPALAVELCSGREGDDAFVRVNRGDRKFNALLRVVEYSIGNLDGSDEKDAVAAAYRDGMFDERERLAKLAIVKGDPPFCAICEHSEHTESCPFYDGDDDGTTIQTSIPDAPRNHVVIDDVWLPTLCTVRYALGRTSYVVGEACDFVRKVRHVLEQWHIDQIAHEVSERIDQGRAGDDCDAREWQSLVDELRDAK